MHSRFKKYPTRIATSIIIPFTIFTCLSNCSQDTPDQTSSIDRKDITTKQTSRQIEDNPRGISNLERSIDDKWNRHFEQPVIAPVATPYDDEAGARDAYIKGYIDGIYEVRNNGVGNCVDFKPPANRIKQAYIDGFYEGQKEESELFIEHLKTKLSERKKMLEQ